jgi:hypothetical protein
MVGEQSTTTTMTIEEGRTTESRSDDTVPGTRPATNVMLVHPSFPPSRPRDRV